VWTNDEGRCEAERQIVYNRAKDVAWEITCTRKTCNVDCEVILGGVNKHVPKYKITFTEQDQKGYQNFGCVCPFTEE
jgi:hypothetical protein